MAVCDAQYRFLLVDIGDAERHSDGGVFSNSGFGQALDLGTLSLPPPQSIPQSNVVAPFVFVADEAFPLKVNMMRPYPGKGLDVSKVVYNYRLSRARRVIENTFGILAARWRIFRRPILATPQHVTTFTKAAVALHNFLRTYESSTYCPPGFTDSEDGSGQIVQGNWRQDVPDGDGLRAIGQVAGNRSSSSAAAIRECYREYFSS